MKRRHLIAASTVSLSLLAACSKSSQQATGGGSAVNTSAAANATVAATGTGVVATTASDNFSSGYYTGFDGTDKFSLLLPSYRPVTIADPSVATITSQSVTISATLIASMVAQLQKTCPTLTAAQATQMSSHLAAPRTIYILTPVGPGTTQLVTQNSGKGGGGGGPGGGAPGGGGSAGGSSNVWETGQTSPVTVVSYTTDQVKAGNTRYHNTTGTGNYKACASCHETGQDGAPSHELGDIMDIDDTDAKTWITTGKLNSRVASIQHTWQFANSDEEIGTVAYLRTLQTTDYETLAQLEFNQEVAADSTSTDSNGCPHGPPPGEATASPTPTPTATATGTGT